MPVLPYPGKGTEVAPKPTEPGPTAAPVGTAIELPLTAPTAAPPTPGAAATDPKLAPYPSGCDGPDGTQTVLYRIVTSAGMSLGTASTASRLASAHAARLTTSVRSDLSARASPVTTIGPVLFCSSSIVTGRTSGSASRRILSTSAAAASSSGIS